jgi:predicted TIM-barrel fold metal-dependent hydrolase
MSFTEDPQKFGYPSIHDEHWDPFWRACDEEGTVVAIHIGSASGMNFTSMDAPVDVMITVTPMSIASCAADLVWSRMLRKYKNLKIALSEGGIGWIPYFLERADYVYKHHHLWTHQDFGDKLPSDVFREHIITCFIDDRVGVQNRHAVGLDTITWECDYPHSDTTWPRAPEILWESLAGVPEHEIHQITHENALREFQLDAFAHRPREKCTAAALRAESPDVDLSLRANEGGKPPRESGSGAITTQDVTTQLASAFAVPAE